ncbi:MAG: DUF1932 domain-containing protein, partial [Acidimicrobiales bacterium]
VVTPPGVDRTGDPVEAVSGARLVLAVTAAADATVALHQAIEVIAPGAVYADLATGPASLKRELATAAAVRGIEFADVALMATVPGKGAATPSLASGPAASAYRRLVAPLGARVEVIGAEPGAAASRKLLRSVVMKGLAAVVIEAMRGGQAAGDGAWLWGELVREITSADGDLLARLVSGTGAHALRRQHEMEAAATMLRELGIDPVMTDATVRALGKIVESETADVPEIPRGLTP